jgi:hypothetical protein
MKFTKKTERWSNPRWYGRKNKIQFEIAGVEGRYYVLMEGENDFRYNTLQDDLRFQTLEAAMEYCENYTKPK